jgi:hypothetical protein
MRSSQEAPNSDCKGKAGNFFAIRALGDLVDKAYAYIREHS